MKRFLAMIMALSVMLSVCSCGQGSYTDTVKIEKGETLMIAHRGLSGLEVENTDSAFIAAGERSYYGIEADVRRTADGKFVICHDDNLKKLSGQKIDVENSTLEELLAVELLGKNEGEVEHLTDLESYIRICKQYDKQAILELKSEFTQDEVNRIIDIIIAEGYTHRVTFISFYYDTLMYVRNAIPGQLAQYLMSKIDDKTIEMLARDKIDVSISYKEINKKTLAKIKAAGLKVNCWTVDDVKTAEKLAKMGVDYITTNILE